MSAILGKNTKPEIIVRKYLHALGYRFRLHRKDLPGSPDIVLAKYKTVILVHGCFWHRHLGCFYTTMPSTRPEFWSDKFQKNIVRDTRQIDLLIGLGWKVLIVWECGLKNLFSEIHTVADIIASGAEGCHVWPSTPPRPKVAE
jgi:DNA mismatch endonuclease (patch repair protein)